MTPHNTIRTLNALHQDVDIKTLNLSQLCDVPPRDWGKEATA
jgi:hypothetical protein